jgi:hypothetical protein
MWAGNGSANSDTPDVALSRARKLQNFFYAEPWTKRPN